MIEETTDRRQSAPLPSPGGPLAALCATAALATVLQFGPLPVRAQPAAEEAPRWGSWQALGSGYVGRRRVPPNAEQPVERRRLASTQATIGARPESRRSDGYLALSSDGPSTVAAEAAVSAAWLRTSAAGLFGASVEKLALTLGREASELRNKASRGRLSLTNAGDPVSWHFDPAGDQILFAAETYDSFHSDENPYRLRRGGRKARPMPVVSGAATGAAGEARPFADSLLFEEEPDFLYATWAVASEPDADYWFWDNLYAGYKDEIQVTLQIPHPAPDGSAQVRIRLRGWTDLEPGDEHQVYAELNGVPIGPAVTWDGFEEALLVADFDQGLLDPSGENSLRLYNDYAPGTHPGQFLDAIEIDYRRRPVAVDGALWVHQAAAGAQTASGFAAADILVIEAPTGKATLREDVRIEADGDGGWTVTFETTEGADYLITERDAVQMPRLVPDYRSTLRKRNNRADYLIIAPRSFAATAEALAEHRRERFEDVRIAWLDDIYDEFNAGREDPSAIGRFMKRVRKAWVTAPAYVTLIGKGTLDHKDRMGYGDSFVPVRMTETPWALAASDDRLLGVETDAPFASGRLPITSDAEGLAYMDKLIAYESRPPGDFLYTAVLAADDPDDGGDFHANFEELTDRLLSVLGFDQVTQLYHPLDEVRPNLIRSDTWDAGYLSYDGHGSATQVGNGSERFITAADAEALDNTEHPIFTALTCAAGDDTNPGARSLAGALVLNPAGGAIASLAPTGLSLDADAQALGMAFVDGLFLEDRSIGEAVRRAKAWTDGSISAFMPRIYSVVGEPLVRARQDGT